MSKWVLVASLTELKTSPKLKGSKGYGARRKVVSSKPRNLEANPGAKVQKTRVNGPILSEAL